jgi:hypothetical protein
MTERKWFRCEYRNCTEQVFVASLPEGWCQCGTSRFKKIPEPGHYSPASQRNQLQQLANWCPSHSSRTAMEEHECMMAIAKQRERRAPDAEGKDGE